MENMPGELVNSETLLTTSKRSKHQDHQVQLHSCSGGSNSLTYPFATCKKLFGILQNERPRLRRTAMNGEDADVNVLTLLQTKCQVFISCLGLPAMKSWVHSQLWRRSGADQISTFPKSTELIDFWCTCGSQPIASCKIRNSPLNRKEE